MSDPTQMEHQARAWLAITLGHVPLVPHHVRERGTPREIISAALERLRTLRLERIEPGKEPSNDN